MELKKGKERTAQEARNNQPRDGRERKELIVEAARKIGRYSIDLSLGAENEKGVVSKEGVSFSSPLVRLKKMISKYVKNW